MTSKSKDHSRRDDVGDRAARPNHMHGYCRVIGCKHPARAGTDDGLDERYCRSHAEHYQRHGSPTKASYTAKELNPYRQAALSWILENEDKHWVQDAIRRVSSLYSKAGRHEEAFRLRGLPPKERARIAIARLRKHGVDPRIVLAACVAVEMILRDDPQSDTRSEFRDVQVAKVVHRMASGTHKRWERELPAADPWSRPKIHVQELHAFPRSRGRVLRHIGASAMSTAELLIEHHLDEIHAYKQLRDEQGRFDDRPYPKGWRARPRSTEGY
ncbi:hypothetical protein [Desulfovibrio subterraneus]|uniref:hypothetical protein n=1 Tax=Desulfovibrio subterraneus TaxID=2718620 RepID=UPI00157A284C|nr:hypothetical protein [Desulfovibrio subterraneus]